ncbi:DUF7668 domain-containing protein [Deinococcus sp.]|uniref:DUF7668 domain-containing protein n=1 Tax=Deinococcus sp. TaxID=47478 RepID=UPI003B595E03
MSVTDSRVRDDIKYIVELLVKEDYQRLQSLDLFPHGDIWVLSERIQDYPGHMTMPPDESFKDFDFIEFEATEDNFFFQADFDLWFNNQASDLTAQFIPSRNTSGLLVCLYDVHVL